MWLSIMIFMKTDLENTKYRVRTQNVTSGTFTVETGLKQRNALSSVFFILALLRVVRIPQENAGGLLINQTIIRLLGFVDDLNKLGDSLADS